MINEFSSMSDGSVRLCVVFEGSPPKVGLKHVELVQFSHPGHDLFSRKFGRLQEPRGLRIEFVSPTQLNIAPDFRFDAFRFSFKIFSILQAIELFRPDSHYAWLDADVRCLRPLSSKGLVEFFPADDEVMSYLGRLKFPLTGAYSECGFLGFNARCSRVSAFLSRMADVYVSGEIFSHREWHDSWIWDQVRLEFERNGDKFKNISGIAENTHHPFINSRLGEFFDHLKGPKRKVAGRSMDTDYVLRKR
jgi:hypothetical protein